MQDIQNNDINPPDDFQDRLIKNKNRNIYTVSPKMSEYIDMVETFLLIREKKVVEKINPGVILLGEHDDFYLD